MQASFKRRSLSFRWYHIKSNKKKYKKKTKLVSNQNGIIAGLNFAIQTFKLIDKKIKFKLKKKKVL